VASDVDRRMQLLSRVIVGGFVTFFLFGVLMGMVNGNTPLAIVCGLLACVGGIGYWVLGRPWLTDGS